MLRLFLLLVPALCTAETFTSSIALESELTTDYPNRIDEVSVLADQVRITGRVDEATPNLFLAEVPMDRLITTPDRFEELAAIQPRDDGSFSITLPRHRQRSDRDYDRLVSRWRIVRKDGSESVPSSHARYAEDVACRAPDLAAANPESKKGLGGWNAGRIDGELEELGISAVTVNIVVHTLLAAGPGPDVIPFSWQGREYHANRRSLESLDATFHEAAANGVMVSAILLVPNPAKDTRPVVRTLAHPNADESGHFGMPYVTSEEGVALYGGILNLMAERWTRPDGKFGRVHHWIVHNEVDAGREWTNAGELPALSYIDLYQRSLHLTDLIVRQYDPNARAFVSLTHHWAASGRPEWYGSRQVLELLTRFTSAEGDFPWALAFHPYPQSLVNPRTWEDSQATPGFDTEKITPKNLEVLDQWMKRPDMRYRETVRAVHLSENGFNSPDYGEASLTDQAAAMAFAWEKIQPLDSIGMWHYHNWIDNRHEGGLRIGLRKFPDEAGAPLEPKPIWFLYRSLGTPNEHAACEAAMQAAGLSYPLNK